MEIQSACDALAPRVLRQLEFLIRIARFIPRLMTVLESGHVEASQKLGGRRLRDGRRVGLWLVAKAPKRERMPLVRGRD